MTKPKPITPHIFQMKGDAEVYRNNPRRKNKRNLVIRRHDVIVIDGVENQYTRPMWGVFEKGE